MSLRFALLVATTAAVNGCSLVSPYPDPGTETTDLECHDGIDNDSDGRTDCESAGCAARCVEICTVEPPPDGGLRSDEDRDGEADCEDRDCDGRCPEDTPASCANGRDDDGDHRTDVEDPSCWPFADVELRSCTSVRGSSRTLEFEPFDGLWAHDPTTFAPDPTGRFAGNVFVVDGSSTGATASIDVDLTGATVGTQLGVDAYVTPDESEVAVALTVLDVPFELVELEVRIAQGRLWATARGVDGSSRPRSVVLTPFVGWVHVEVEITDGQRIRARATVDGVEVGSVEIPSGEPRFADVHELGLRLDARRGGTGPVVIGQIRVVRAPFRPCDVEVPSATASERALSLFPSGVALRGRSICVAGFDPVTSGARLSTSVDRGLTWTTDPPAPPGGMLGFVGVSATPDGVVHGLVHGDPRMFWATSADCRAVDVAAGPTPVTDAGLPIGYALLDDEHVLVRLTEPVAGERRLTHERVSADGSVLAAADLGALSGEIAAATAALVGNDILVASRARAPATASIPLAVSAAPPRTEPAVVPFATLERSGLPGACDADAVTLPAIAIDRSPVIDGAAATGLAVFECPATGSGLVARQLIVWAR